MLGLTLGVVLAQERLQRAALGIVQKGSSGRRDGGQNWTGVGVLTWGGVGGVVMQL